jgi:hypothetical protein
MPGPAFVQAASTGTSGTSTSLAFPSPVGAGNLIVVHVIPDNGVQYTSASDNNGDTARGAPVGFFGNAVNVGPKDNNYFSIFYAENVAGGATTVTVDCNGTDAFGTLIIEEYSGLAGSGSLDGANGQLDPSVSPITSGNITTTVAGDLIVASFYDPGQGVGSSDNGFTVRIAPGFGSLSAKDRIAGAAGAYAGISNASGDSVQIAMAAAFKAAPTGDTGAAAQVLGRLRQAATGAEVVSGAAAQRLGRLRQSATGAEGESGVASQHLGRLRQAAAGAELIPGVALQRLAGLRQSAAGLVPIIGAAGQRLRRLVQSATGSGGGVFAPVAILLDGSSPLARVTLGDSPSMAAIATAPSRVLG